MTEEHLTLYRQLSETKVYKERFGELKGEDRVDAGLPPVFDPENPERCLVGMLNGAINLERMSGDWTVLSGSDGHGFYAHRVSDDHLDIALIKAILKQEGL